MPDGSIAFEIDGRSIDFVFPEQANAKMHFENILEGKDYPPIPHALAPGYEPSFILDVGANVGATALFLRKLYPNACIHCVEPSPSNFKYLQRNVGRLEDVTCHNFGLAGADATARLYQGNSQCLQHSMYPSLEVGDAFEEIQIRNAADVVREIGSRVDFLKVDTEGAEVEIMRSLAGLLCEVDVIYYEYHSETDRRAIEAHLKDDFTMWFATGDYPHRGNRAWFNNKLASRYPLLHALKIES